LKRNQLKIGRFSPRLETVLGAGVARCGERRELQVTVLRLLWLWVRKLRQDGCSRVSYDVERLRGVFGIEDDTVRNSLSYDVHRNLGPVLQFIRGVPEEVDGDPIPKALSAPAATGDTGSRWRADDEDVVVVTRSRRARARLPNKIRRSGSTARTSRRTISRTAGSARRSWFVEVCI